jgi:hypothetical protein
MTSKVKRAQYTLEFKLEAVRLVKVEVKQFHFGPKETVFQGHERAVRADTCRYVSRGDVTARLVRRVYI